MAKISPVYPRPKVLRMATSHSVPPTKTMERGNSKRAKGAGAVLVAGLSTERPQQRTGDDVALNLAGSLPDSFDAGIAPDAFERQIVHEAHAAMDLDGLIRDHGKAFGGLELRHGHVHVLDRSVVIFPGGLERDEPGRPELDCHVGELEGHALKFADLLAELGAVDGPLLGMIEGAFGAADAGRGHLKPRRPEPCVRHLETFVHFSEDGARRHPAVGELEDAVVIATVRNVPVA